MSGLTDFQTAMVVLFGIVLVFGLALAAQTRRPLAPPLSPADRFDAVAADVADLKAKQTETDHNISQIRTILGALPSTKSFHELELKVTALDGKHDVTNAIVVSTGRTVERIETYLLRSDR